MDCALSLCRRAGFWLAEPGRRDVQKRTAWERPGGREDGVGEALR